MFSMEEDINLELELTFNGSKDKGDVDGYPVHQYNRQRPGNNTRNIQAQAQSSSTTSSPPSTSKTMLTKTSRFVQRLDVKMMLY